MTDMTHTVTEVDTVQIMVRRMHLGARLMQILFVLVVMVLHLLIRPVTVVIPKHAMLCMFLHIKLFVINMFLSV